LNWKTFFETSHAEIALPRVSLVLECSLPCLHTRVQKKRSGVRNSVILGKQGKCQGRCGIYCTLWPADLSCLDICTFAQSVVLVQLPFEIVCCFSFILNKTLGWFQFFGACKLCRITLREVFSCLKLLKEEVKSFCDTEFSRLASNKVFIKKEI